MTSESPTTLQLHLAAPGMGPLHRAGLGGLAATLLALQQSHETNKQASKLPGPKRADGSYPWTITPKTITLDFGKPDKASAYLERLFNFAFDVERFKGLIFMPGQHDTVPSPGVLAELQSALGLTFLQHGKTRKQEKDSKPFEEDVGDNKKIRYEFRPCSWFRHKSGWEDVVKGPKLSHGSVEVAGPLYPGAVVRHVAFTADTRIEETPQRILPLYFAIVGCIALTDHRGTGLLLVPEVTNLEDFAVMRPAMTPRRVQDCQVGGGSDAALQAQLRIHAARLPVPAIYTMTFRSTAWASQQKSRVLSLTVPNGEGLGKQLDRFGDALRHLPSRVIQKVETVATGRGKAKQVTEKTTTFFADSLIRPIAADNIARNKPWYLGFARLMSGPSRNKINFEREGLIKMVNDDTLYDDAGEQAVVRCVHSALRSRYAQIAEDNKGKPVAMKNRFNGEYERWRLAFAGSKTPDQFRACFADLVSRGGPGNKPLQEAWGRMLPFLRNERWQHARDLSLLALASYESQSSKANKEKEEK